MLQLNESKETFMINNKLKGPKKGSFEKLSNRLKELGQQPPPEKLMEILNQTEIPRAEKEKKTASSLTRKNELDI